MKLELSVDIPDELFEEFMLTVKTFDFNHPGMKVVCMCSDSKFTAEDMKEIFGRVMPGAQSHIIPIGKEN